MTFSSLRESCESCASCPCPEKRIYNRCFCSLHCAIWKVEDAPILLCLGGRGSFVLTSRKSQSPADAEIPFLHKLWCAGAHLSSFAQTLSSVLAMVCPCWGWALLCYPLVFAFLLSSTWLLTWGRGCQLLSLLLLFHTVSVFSNPSCSLDPHSPDYQGWYRMC